LLASARGPFATISADDAQDYHSDEQQGGKDNGPRLANKFKCGLLENLMVDGCAKISVCQDGGIVQGRKEKKKNQNGGIRMEGTGLRFNRPARPTGKPEQEEQEAHVSRGQSPRGLPGLVLPFQSQLLM